MHAGTRDGLVGIHQVLALAEGVEHHGHRADVEGVAADPQQVVQDAGDSSNIVPDVLGAHGTSTPQLLDGQTVGVLVAHHRHVVETVHVRHRLDPGAGLGELLGRAMQEADVRVGALDDFAVQFQHEAQHAVLPPGAAAEVQGVIVDLGHLRDLRRFLRARCAGCFRAARSSPAGR